MLTVILSLVSIISLLSWAYFSLAQFQKILPFTRNNNVLILTAHPDDECMFFGPTISSLKSLAKSRVHVLCLSTGNKLVIIRLNYLLKYTCQIGNADGLGSIRKKELVKSCQTFGIQPHNVRSLDNP
jgi:N-acetylglucosaminylphosphatidylinositol deacetylase